MICDRYAHASDVMPRSTLGHARGIGAAGRTSQLCVADRLQSGIRINRNSGDGGSCWATDAEGGRHTRFKRSYGIDALDGSARFTAPSCAQRPGYPASVIVATDRSMSASMDRRKQHNRFAPLRRDVNGIEQVRPVAPRVATCSSSNNSCDPYDIGGKNWDKNWSLPQTTLRKLTFSSASVASRFAPATQGGTQSMCKRTREGRIDPYNARRAQSDTLMRSSRLHARFRPEVSPHRSLLFSRGGFHAGGTGPGRLQIERTFNKDYSKFGL